MPSPRNSRHRVQLVLSPLIRVPAVKAYHSSVLIDGKEFWFSLNGLSMGKEEGLISHQRCYDSPHIIEMGHSNYAPQDLIEALGPHFRPGSYDMVRKNCNSFSDCAIFFLLSRRLSAGYYMLDTLAAGCPSVAQMILGKSYAPNPKAENFSVEAIISGIGSRRPGGATEEAVRRSPSAPATCDLAGWSGWLDACRQCDRVQQRAEMSKTQSDSRCDRLPLWRFRDGESVRHHDDAEMSSCCEGACGGRCERLCPLAQDRPTALRDLKEGSACHRVLLGREELSAQNCSQLTNVVKSVRVRRNSCPGGREAQGKPAVGTLPQESTSKHGIPASQKVGPLLNSRQIGPVLLGDTTLRRRSASMKENNKPGRRLL